MASKATRRARNAAKGNAPAEKDDGTRWIVVRHGRPVYPSHGGTTKRQAERLAEGLIEPAELLQVSTK